MRHFGAAGFLLSQDHEASVFEAWPKRRSSRTDRPRGIRKRIHISADVRYMFRLCESRAMADLPSAYPLRDLFDAAVRHRAIALTCTACGHVRVFDPHALWWLFHRRGWPNRFGDVRRRCVCSLCLQRTGRKIRGPRLDLVQREPTGLRLMLPSTAEWKRELSRRR